MKRSEIPRDSGSVVGCYSMDLYCSHPNHMNDYYRLLHGGAAYVADFPTSFTGHTQAECFRTARKDGWWVSKADEHWNRAVLCPYHARDVPR